MRLNAAQRNFRVFGPDETESNRLGARPTGDRQDVAGTPDPRGRNLAADGRVMEILSEHTCQGWLEGYLLTGRHGLFSCYEAFIAHRRLDVQPARQVAEGRPGSCPGGGPIASLNYLLTSHVWRQDHNGFSHQDPGFIDHVLNKKAEVVRVYLPPGRQHPAVRGRPLPAQPGLRQRDRGGQAARARTGWTWTPRALHCARGAGIWEWAGSDSGGTEPDVVLACAGDVPTLEILAATDILRRHLPELAVRVVNVVDLMRLQPASEHPHGMTDAEFDALFTPDRPVIFAYHGYPWLIHRLTYRRAGHANLHVRGYKEEGTTTTPFDMVVLNDMDRYHLVMDVIDRVPGLGRPRPRGCASRWPTPGPGTTPGSASTAPTCPRSPTGPGPARDRAGPRAPAADPGPVLVVNAGVEQPQAQPARPGAVGPSPPPTVWTHWDGRRATAALRRVPGGLPGVDRRRPPGRARRPVGSPGAGGHRRRRCVGRSRPA